MQRTEPIAIVRAVAVPSEPNRSGTTTKSVDAGVTQDSVRRVPPTMPMERFSCCGFLLWLWGLSDVASETAAPAVERVSVTR